MPADIPSTTFRMRQGHRREVEHMLRNEKHFRGDTLVIRPVGAVTVATATQWKQDLEQVLADGTDVVVDLGDTTVVDSSGLDAFLSATERAHTLNRSLRFASPPDRIQALLTLTNLHTVLPLYASVDAAVHR
jgi:anti-sigma B factor antagonist